MTVSRIDHKVGSRNSSPANKNTIMPRKNLRISFTVIVVLYTINMQEDSVFTKIIKGELPSHRVYEDELSLAIMSIDPLTPGHVVLFPKVQVAHLWDVDDELYQHLMDVSRKIAKRIREVLISPRAGLIVDGFGVQDHAHINICPFYQGIEHTVSEHISKGHREPDHTALEEMAQKLAF